MVDYPWVARHPSPRRLYSRRRVRVQDTLRRDTGATEYSLSLSPHRLPHHPPSFDVFSSSHSASGLARCRSHRISTTEACCCCPTDDGNPSLLVQRLSHPSPEPVSHMHATLLLAARSIGRPRSHFNIYRTAPQASAAHPTSHDANPLAINPRWPPLQVPEGRPRAGPAKS